MGKCPGQDRRKLKAATVPCSGCGYAVEVFSDEVSVRCPECGARVMKEALPSCTQWCKAAKECIGEDAVKKPNGG
jgi:DNA-directed RNA polymerase subunit RPC12/RpoP